MTDNLLSICVNRMPRRNNGTLLHEASSFEGAEYLVCFITEAMAKDKLMIDLVDNDKKTSLSRTGRRPFGYLQDIFGPGSESDHQNKNSSSHIHYIGHMG